MSRRPLPLSAIVAFIADRREQYDQSSGIFAALEDLAAAFRNGDAHEAYRTGELDDLLPRSARCDDVNAYAEHHEEYAETADWRARALAAEAVIDQIASLSVFDGGAVDIARKAKEARRG